MDEDSVFDGERAAYLTWDGIRSRMADSTRSEEGKIAGLWAIDELRAILGQSWPGLCNANYLQVAFMNSDAYRQLLELALRLHLLRNLSGMARVRRELVSNVQPERRLHTQLQLNVASLAVQCGIDVELEKSMASNHAPTDLVLSSESKKIGIEVFVVHMDMDMRQGIIYNNRIDYELNRIRARCSVEITGNLDFILNEIDTRVWLEQIEQLALKVKYDGYIRSIIQPSSSIKISTLKNSINDEISFTGPWILGKTNFRLYERLTKKAEQAVKAGAVWIRVDVMDGLWQFTPWAAQSIQDQSQMLANELIAILSAIVGLHGAVLSSGSGMCSSPIKNEFTQLAGNGFALAVNLPPSRARETIIVPMHSDYEKEAALWTEMYKGEPEWLDWALNKVGLPSSSAVFA